MLYYTKIIKVKIGGEGGSRLHLSSARPTRVSHRLAVRANGHGSGVLLPHATKAVWSRKLSYSLHFVPLRRGWESNPRGLLTLPLFESGTFDHSDTSPLRQFYRKLLILSILQSHSAQTPPPKTKVFLSPPQTSFPPL